MGLERGAKPGAGHHRAPPLSSPVAADGIPPGGLSGKLEAAPGEREALAAFFNLAGLDRLTFHYDILPIGRGRLRLTGRLDAELTQTCVVTLEPVAASVSGAVTIEYWPEDALTPRPGSPRQADAGPWDADPPEPIIDGRIDPGQIAAELLSINLDPYPRKPGASFEWRDKESGGSEARSHSAFTALAKLKRSKP